MQQEHVSVFYNDIDITINMYSYYIMTLIQPEHVAVLSNDIDITETCSSIS